MEDAVGKMEFNLASLHAHSKPIRVKALNVTVHYCCIDDVVDNFDRRI
jgi:hypothetical protein